YGVGRVRTHNAIGGAGTARSAGQQVRCVKNRGDGSERVDLHAAHTINDLEVGSKASVAKVGLGRERALGQIERDVLEEAAEVVIDLRLAFAEGVDRRAEARRPRAGEAIADAGTVRAGVADQPLLLVAQACERGNVPVDAPRVLYVPGVVVRIGVECGVAVFAARLAQVDANRVRAAGDSHERAER